MKKISDRGAEHRLTTMERTLHSIDKTLAINTEQLKTHMARTEQIEKELLPLVKFRQQMVGAGKLLAILATVAAITSAALMF